MIFNRNIQNSAPPPHLKNGDINGGRGGGYKNGFIA